MTQKLGDLKVDFLSGTNINPDELPDELKEIYKNMQGHFTKRTQEAIDAKKTAEGQVDLLAKEKEKFDAEIKELQEKNTALQTSLDRKGKSDNILDFLNLDEEPGGGGSDADAQKIADLTDKIGKLSRQVDQLSTALEEKTTGISKVIKYQQDLTELGTLHDETFGKPLDKKALINFAIEQELPDIHKAYELFTKDATIEMQAEKRAGEIYKERIEKEETFATGSGLGTPRIFARDDEKTPKTFGDATMKALKEIRSKV